MVCSRCVDSDDIPQAKKHRHVWARRPEGDISRFLSPRCADATDVRPKLCGMVDEYLENASQLERLVSLVDASVGVKESDEQLWEMLQQRGRSLMVVLTQIDKVDAEGLNRSMAHVISLLQRHDNTLIWPYVHAVSGLRGHGVQELRTSLSAIVSDFEATRRQRQRPPHVARPERKNKSKSSSKFVRGDHVSQRCRPRACARMTFRSGPCLLDIAQYLDAPGPARATLKRRLMPRTCRRIALAQTRPATLKRRHTSTKCRINVDQSLFSPGLPTLPDGTRSLVRYREHARCVPVASRVSGWIGVVVVRRLPFARRGASSGSRWAGPQGGAS